ncbi:extracellular solute-binding protein [Methylobacterium sp. Leaf100]|uniref:extracellular solute-binding protein n=1 Tax=Methylobacterium sp. Leaf100 TaxID=1736252 RepID=UPI00070051C4|nr:extracellular solute-binding protein [Methylobacterium sp. Leaf100]KQP19017.1 tungsten ABC transporter substrate-binding protein [Methylobacterium sp. Leaf100]
MDFPRRGVLTLGLLALLGASPLGASPASAEPASIVVASTTSTEQSGLFKHILPAFAVKTGIAVKVVALGTGQALDAARRGDADVVLVHDRPAEDAFVAQGFAKARFDVMYNDFVLVGPKGDPAGTKGTDITAALRNIAAAKASFVSRGDRSGTHSAELRSWKEAGIDLPAVKGEWYRDVGQGMGPALNTASALNAYILADRGTWLAFKNRGDLAILVEGDKRLFNPYGVMLVNPDKHPTVKVKEGQAFIDWLVSPEGQASIAAYRIGGEQLFFPSAGTVRAP